MTITIHPQFRAFWDRLLETPSMQWIQKHLPQANFILFHYLYFVATCMIFSIIFYCTSKPMWSISYTDSLFLVISAMTEAGLNTVNLSQMTLFQQMILFFLIIIGSPIFVSISTVLIRKRAFEKHFKHIIKLQKDVRRRRRSSFSEPLTTSTSSTVGTGLNIKTNPRVTGQTDTSEFESRHSRPRDPTLEATPEHSPMDSTTDVHPAAEVGMTPHPDLPFGRDETATAPYPVPGPARVLSFEGVGAMPRSGTSVYRLVSPDRSLTNRRRDRQNSEVIQKEEINGEEPANYTDYVTKQTTGRNAQFFGLTRTERDHLGGVEYRAISLLSWIVPAYFALWQVLGCIGLGAYMAANKASTSLMNGIQPWWLGFFNGASAFNNSGMSLLDANMIPFQTSIYPVTTMGLMILAGNTAYPLFLRLILWSLLKLLVAIYKDETKYSEEKETLQFILKYPRRVYTNLFPSKPTWWLTFMLIILNGFDWAMFEILNIGNTQITSAIPKRFRVLDGLFQALAVRSGGFYIVSIPTLRIGVQFLYVVMMYISVYPVTITMRHSNVYEERSLGIYADDDTASDIENQQGPKLGTLGSKLKRTIATTFSYPFTGVTPATQKTTGDTFIRQQLRGQLAHDLWWLVVATWAITCIETSQFERDPAQFSVFNTIFEVVSGYGCVGISVGLQDQAYSYSGSWHKASKLILCLVMLRGRHRGLPVALDKAVRLPHREKGDSGELEEEDMEVRRSLSMDFRSLNMSPMRRGTSQSPEMRRRVVISN